MALAGCLVVITVMVYSLVTSYTYINTMGKTESLFSCTLSQYGLASLTGIFGLQGRHETNQGLTSRGAQSQTS